MPDAATGEIFATSDFHNAPSAQESASNGLLRRTFARQQVAETEFKRAIGCNIRPYAASAPGRASERRGARPAVQPRPPGRAARCPARCSAGRGGQRPDAGPVLLDVRVGVVAGAHEWAGGDVVEAELVGGLLEGLELVRVPVADDREVALGRA
jgi:hypothetical protein